MALTALVSSQASGVPVVAARTGQRPNVLIIVTDDQRYGLSVMPNTRQHFRDEGRTYPRAFVTTPLCCPSRATIMTGRYAHNHGVTRNSYSGQVPPFPDMLQAKLQAAGYRTAIFGKYLNAWPVGSAPPDFDDFAISTSGYRDRTWNVNGTMEAISGYNTGIIGEKAVAFIEAQRRHGAPWLLYVTPYAPHRPFEAEPAFANLDVGTYGGNPATREADRSDKPRFVRAQSHTYEERGAAIREGQLRTLRSVDDLVGRLFSALRRTGQENTLAIYLSDNGMLWGEHGLLSKSVPYTHAVKVPFFARWPDHIEPGSSDRRIVANVDIAPTVLHAPGLPAEEFDGRDLLDPSWVRRRLLLEYWCNLRRCRRWASTRTRHSQYTEYYDADGRVRFREYYDLKADPWQLRNLYRDGVRSNAPDTARLRRRLAADRVCVARTCP